MGAEREDTDPTARDSKSGGRAAATEPGLGPSSGKAPAAEELHALDVLEEEPAPVDFDALHAALGDPIDYDEMPSGPALEKGVPHDGLDGDEVELHVDSPTNPPLGANANANANANAQTSDRGKSPKQTADSSGRTNATYASGPHTIPPTRAPMEDLNAPAVIVASDTDTVPSAPPQMTVKQTVQLQRFTGGQGGQAPHGAHGTPPSNPHMPGHLGPPGAGHPSSGSHPTAGLGVAYPYTPVPFPAQQPARGVGPSRNAVAQMTMRMPDRPVNPRRQKTPTIVVRQRGPSTKQKLLAFMAMLLLVTACGVAVIIWRRPRLLGLEPAGPASAAPSAAVSGSSMMPSPAASGLATAAATTGGPGSAGLGVANVTSPAGSAGAPAVAASGASSSGPAGSSSAKKTTAPKPPAH